MIRALTDDDLAASLAIVDEGIGVGWVGADDLRPMPARRAVVAEHEGRVAGVATAMLRPVDELRDGGNPELWAALSAEIDGAAAPILVLDVAVVAPSARGRGLYTALVEDRVAWGRRQGAPLAMAIGWTPPDGCHIAPAMARSGFARRAELAGFYWSPSIAAGAVCPACGEPPCECAAILFTRRIAPA